MLTPTSWLEDRGLIPRTPGGARGQGGGCSFLEDLTVQKGKRTSRRTQGGGELL